MDSTPVELLNAETGNVVEALLFDDISHEHLIMQESQWPEGFAQLDSIGFPQEDSHWQWPRKLEQRRGLLNFEAFCIEKNGSIEGLMTLHYSATSRIPEQLNKDIVYIEYLATAPWNRYSLKPHAQHRYVGRFLIMAAIQLSFSQGLKGRIGLHSLPKAESFYRDKVGMLDMGPDPACQDLRYFELSESCAQQIPL